MFLLTVSLLWPPQILKKISMYIQEQNEKIYAPRGLLLTDPIERGMRVVSFANTREVFMLAPAWKSYVWSVNFDDLLTFF